MTMLICCQKAGTKAQECRSDAPAFKMHCDAGSIGRDSTVSLQTGGYLRPPSKVGFRAACVSRVEERGQSSSTKNSSRRSPHTKETGTRANTSNSRFAVVIPRVVPNQESVMMECIAILVLAVVLFLVLLGTSW